MRLLQDAMDSFVRERMKQGGEAGALAEECMEGLADYLVHYSDLFRDELAEAEEPQLADWEEALEAQMNELMDGDMDAGPELHGLELAQLEPEHMRDFFGWYLLREIGDDATGIEAYAETVRDWLAFMRKQGDLDQARHLEFMAVVNDMADECVRAARAMRLLFHYVRLGGGGSPRLRGQRFSRFVEGHARVLSLGEHQVWLGFDSQSERIGPVPVAREIAALLREGDVLDVELGLRGDVWLMVDIGPVYPASVYVEAEEFGPPGKVS